VGLAEDDEPGFAEARDDRAVSLVSRVAEEARAFGRDRARHADGEILEQVGHASEGALGKGLAGGASRPLEVVDGDRGDRRVDRFGASDCDLEQLCGRDLSAAHERGQSERVVAPVLLEGHRRARGRPRVRRAGGTAGERRRSQRERRGRERSLLQEATSGQGIGHGARDLRPSASAGPGGHRTRRCVR